MERLLASFSGLELGPHPQLVQSNTEQRATASKKKWSPAGLSRTLCSTRDGTRLFAVGVDGGLWTAVAEDVCRTNQKPSADPGDGAASATTFTPVNLHPLLCFCPRACTLSCADRFLALYDEQYCAVVDTRALRSASMVMPSRAAIASQTVLALLLGTPARQRSFSLKTIRQVSWHPWSDGHLGILFDDGELELYDVLTAILPEQTLRIRLPLEEISELPSRATLLSASEKSVTTGGQQRKAVSEQSSDTTESVAPAAFAFAPASASKENPWEILSLYLLRETDGAVFLLCPFAPTGVQLSSDWVEAVSRQADAALPLETNELMAGNTSLSWADMQSRLQKQWLGLCISRQTGTGRDEKVTPTESCIYRLMRPPIKFARQWQPLLQGPAHVEHDTAATSHVLGPACGLTILSSPLGPILLRTWWHGVIDVLISMEPTEPVWGLSVRCVEQLPSVEDVAPSFLLYERIYLGSPCSHSLDLSSGLDASVSCAANDDRLPMPLVTPAQVVPRRQRSVLLVRAHQGVFILYLTWLDVISGLLAVQSPATHALDASETTEVDPTEQDRLEQQLEHLPSSVLVQAMTTAAAPLGVAELRPPTSMLFNQRHAAHMLLAMDSEGRRLDPAVLRWWHLPVSQTGTAFDDKRRLPGKQVNGDGVSFLPRTSFTALAPTKLEQKVAQAFGSLPPWSTAILSSNEDQQQQIEHLVHGARTLALVWSIMQKTIQPLRLLYVEVIQPTMHQLTLQTEEHERQCRAMRQRLGVLQSRARDLQHRCGILAIGMGENLQRRLEGMEELMFHRQPIITPAERQYFRQLEHYLERVREMREQAAKLQSRVAQLGRSHQAPGSAAAVHDEWSLLRQSQRREIQRAISENAHRLEKLQELSSRVRKILKQFTGTQMGTFLRTRTSEPLE
jgi:hypothetical protein